LDRGDERQRDRLTGLVAGLRAGCGVAEAIEQDIRVGLEPHDPVGQHLTDLLHLSIHPLFMGSGGALFRDGVNTTMTLVAAKTCSRIVKLSSAPQYS
jgi:hypothetical protein